MLWRKIESNLEKKNLVKKYCLKNFIKKPDNILETYKNFQNFIEN